MNGTLFFSANDGTHGDELWESNGSAAGTFMVKDINPGSNGSYPYGLTNVNGTLFFEANDGTHGYNLWESNGSAAGTFMVKDINPGITDPYRLSLTNVNGTLFFETTDGVHGFELWASNGSAAGTFLVKDINPGPAGSYFRYPTNVNGTLFFQANDGTHGFDLWESNGSAAGTFLVGDINPGSASSYPSLLTNANGNLFFAADDGVHGTEPWIVPSPATTTTVSSTPNPSVVGQAVTFTATISAVSPGLPAPTGTVDFTEGSTDLTPGGVTVTNGQATFSTVALVVGSDTITANYNGDSNFLISSGSDSSAPQVVNEGETSTANVVSSSNPSVHGQTVTFSVTVNAVAPAAGVPTGMVTFSDQGGMVGSGTLNTSGLATFTTSTLSASVHTITASYGGDGNFSGSNDTATPLVQIVSQAMTSTGNVASSVNPSVHGQTVTFSVTVSAVGPGAGVLTGTVTFSDQAGTLGSGTLNGSGLATFTTSTLSTSVHTVTASYGGDGNFSGSNDTATPLVQTVSKANTTVGVTALPANPVFGQTLTFTALVAQLPQFEENSSDFWPLD